MGYGYRGGGRGGRRGQGQWPGNGPFRHLPPWERPGWVYGRGSCWTLGYWGNAGSQVGAMNPPAGIPEGTPNELQILRSQKDLIEKQLKSLQDALERIEKRLSETTEQ